MLTINTMFPRESLNDFHCLKIEDYRKDSIWKWIKFRGKDQRMSSTFTATAVSGGIGINIHPMIP